MTIHPATQELIEETRRARISYAKTGVALRALTPEWRAKIAATKIRNNAKKRERAGVLRAKKRAASLVERPCDGGCGKPMTLLRGQLTHRNFCSRDCYKMRCRMDARKPSSPKAPPNRGYSKPPAVVSQVKLRRCLGPECGVMFRSDGPWNRICRACSDTTAFISSQPDPVIHARIR